MLKNRQISHICRKKHKSITYDVNGAVLTDGLRQYAYDSEGRLAAASLGWANTSTSDDSITKYAHNAQAQRVFKTAPLYAVTNPPETATPSVLAVFTTFFESLWSPSTATTQKAGMSYVYDEDGTLIADTLTGGASTTWGQSAKYIYLPTASGPMPIAAIYGTKHYAIQTDHLNTPRRLTQSDGQVAWQWAYSAFGDEKPTIASNRFANTDLNQSFGTTTVAAVTFNLRYPGQYFDQESGLHYNLNRSYSSTIGRYTQSDPIGLDGGWNRFGYVGGNPLSFTDPLGLERGPASPNIGDPIPPSTPLPGNNRGDNSASGTFCEPYSPIKKWVCEKCVNLACSAGIVSNALCCGEAHRQCVIKAATDGGDASKCAAELMTCNAYGGRGSK